MLPVLLMLQRVGKVPRECILWLCQLGYMNAIYAIIIETRLQFTPKYIAFNLRDVGKISWVASIALSILPFLNFFRLKSIIRFASSV